MRYFDENIIALIDMLEYDMYVVQPDPSIDCVCKNYDTKQGDPRCPRCLGTGQKIKIRKIKGVRQPDNIAYESMGITTEKGWYFFKNDYKVHRGDLLIWNNEVEEIVKVDRYCSDSNMPVYYYCEVVRKKADVRPFLLNFYRAIRSVKK